LAALSGIGLAMIYRIDLANADSAERAGRSAPSAYAPLQMMWTLVAVALFVGVLIVVKDHRALARYSYTAGLLGILLLLLPAVPGIGATINGARLWLRVGPLTFQPSEISKLLLLIFFAGFLMRKRDVLSVVTKSILGIPFPRARDLGPVLIAWGASLGMLFIENDLGQGILVFGMFLAVIMSIGACFAVGDLQLAGERLQQVAAPVPGARFPSADGDAVAGWWSGLENGIE